MKSSNKIIEKKWVSEIIGEEYKNWKNEFVALDCDTGCGKTYFCINVLGKYCKENNKSILYLCNRTKLKKQVINQVESKRLSETIFVITYQKLQIMLQNKEKIEHYDYIIADECHYFTTDATFNDATDMAFNWLGKQKESVVLWVSATAKIFFGQLLEQNYLQESNYYQLEKDYSYVKKLYYYQKKELNSIIDDILANEKDSKIVVFCNSTERILEMQKIYDNAACYYCSKNTKDKRLLEVCGWLDSKGNLKDDNEIIIEQNENLITFKKRILFTTKVLDNGVDLKDIRIKHIFSEMMDVDTLIQSLGRKRSLSKNDTCSFYVREYKGSGIQGMINRIQTQLEPVDLYKRDYKSFYNAYGKKRSKLVKENQIFYNYFAKDKTSKIKVNNCRYRKYKQDLEMYKSMKKLGYKGYLATVFPDYLNQISEDMVVGVEEIDKFLIFLKSIEGKRLYAAEQKIVKEEFEIIGVKLRYKGINTFNGALEDTYKDAYECRFYGKDENGKEYRDGRSKTDDGKANPNVNKRYWILRK